MSVRLTRFGFCAILRGAVDIEASRHVNCLENMNPCFPIASAGSLSITPTRHPLVFAPADLDSLRQGPELVAVSLADMKDMQALSKSAPNMS